VDRKGRLQWGPGDLQVLHTPFEHIFKSEDKQRDKFLSRLFGLFNEDAVRYWSKSPGAVYEDLGRPTLYDLEEKRGYTLDFALKHRGLEQIFVSEMKCELEYDGYRYLRLANDLQIDHHKSTAFSRFLELSRDPSRFVVKVSGKEVSVAGTVLIWGAISPAGRQSAMARFGFADVLSIEDMLIDLRTWDQDTGWPAHVAKLKGWSEGLFDDLVQHPAF
jgi:hypothetical protein